MIALLIMSGSLLMLYQRKIRFLKTGLFLPAALFILVIAFQLMPLPLGLLRLIQSKTAELYFNMVPGRSITGFALSIYPSATLFELFKILCYFGLFFFVINFTRSKKEFERLFNFIVFFGLVVSLLGVLQKYSGVKVLFWLNVDNTMTTSFGPFINRNNFAGFVNLIIPFALAYCLTDIPLSRKVLYGLSAGVMSLSIFLSLSRGGILVYLATLIFFLLISRLHPYFRQKVKTVFMVLILAFCLVILFTQLRSVSERFTAWFGDKVSSIFGHGYAWKDILRIWSDFPVFGTGLGTFASISSAYKTSFVQELFTYAHNDLLQLLSEAGIAGFVFLVWFFLRYFISIVGSWIKRNDAYVVCLVLGGMASVFSAVIYSLLDFNLHIPANAILFFVIMGLVYVLANTHFAHDKPKHLA